jgi:hypothetical protein
LACLHGEQVIAVARLPRRLVSAEDLLGDCGHLGLAEPRVDAGVAKGAEEALDVLLQLEKLPRERPGGVVGQPCLGSLSLESSHSPEELLEG